MTAHERQHLLRLIYVLVERLGGRVEIDKIELRDSWGRDLSSYEDIAKHSIIIQTRRNYEDALRNSPPVQRTTYGGDCVATVVQPEQHGGDEPFYEIVEDHVPQLPQLADPSQAPSWDQPSDQSST